MTSRISRRRLVRGLGTAAGFAVLNPLGCSRRNRETSTCFRVPGATVRWIVPFPPGGGFDVYSRLLEPFYQRKLGAEIAIENIPGAGGIIAATTLKDSEPNGLTLGILNAPGLVVASLTGETSAPSPSRDLTILGRIVRNRIVWVAGRNSAFRSIDDVLVEARRRPILFGMSEVGSTNFVNMAVGSSLLGIEAEFIAGFAGSRETSMATLRGEVDIASFTFESILDRIELDDLRPILQMSSTRILPHPSLDGVATLCGEGGIVTRRAHELGRDERDLEADAQALTRLTEAGLLVAAPPRLDERLGVCLKEKLYEALTDPDFQTAAARANRSLSVGRAEEALADIRAAAGHTERFMPVIRAAIRRIREVSG